MDHIIANLNWIEAIGWLGSLITIGAYAVNTMLPLRILAIISSAFFLTYAIILQLWPVLILEMILLPINIFRFWQLVSLRKKLRTAAEGKQADFSVIKAYGKRQRLPAGSVVFERGDAVDQLYYLAKGRVQIEDVDVDLAPGDVFGEIAFFADVAIRTATARCVEDTEVYGITETQFMRLQFEDPSFGLAIMRTITRRLTMNLTGAPALV